MDQPYYSSATLSSYLLDTTLGCVDVKKRSRTGNSAAKRLRNHSRGCRAALFCGPETPGMGINTGRAPDGARRIISLGPRQQTCHLG